LGFAELLEDSDLSQEERGDFASRIQQSGDYLLNLMNELLDVARLQVEESLTLKKTDLNKILTSSLVNLEPSAVFKHISLDFVDMSQGSPIEVYINAGAMKRVVNNLVSNAIKFSHEGASVKITISSPNPKLVTLSFQDFGIGIPKDKLHLVFDKFTKAGQKGTQGEKSTGLGMHITKNLVEKMHGIIEVDSTEGTGTTFSIGFPLDPH
ncbi:MAG: HAMP domain-containing sensor histidine kinase, partial [SAR324 cluster bacterium]|nr:HAMP domain-containing sensor histidine kinase [SAR324 cluster bacterium]